MGPEVGIIGGLLSAAGTVVGAVAQSNAMNAQAAADQQRARIEEQWAERRALEERSAAQRAATQEKRQAQLAQSRLVTLAAASGGRADDPTVMDLWGDVEKEGQYNAAQQTAAGEQKSAGMRYQAALNTWTADSNANIARQGAKATLIGGILGAGGQFFGGMSRMGARYGGGGTSYGRTGYG